MKKAIYVLLSIGFVLLGFMGCQKEKLTKSGNMNTTISGKTMMLTVNVMGVGVKYKAIDDPDNPSETSEGIINNHTIFVFNNSGNLDVPAVYVEGDAPKTDILVTSKATEVYVVANGGNPKDPSSFLGSKLANQSLSGYKNALFSIETNISDQNVLGLLRTGASAIDVEEDADGKLSTAEVTIGLKFVAAKVVADWRVEDDVNTGNPNLVGAMLTGIYILNGRAESHIFGATLDDNGNNNSSTSRKWGPLYLTANCNFSHGKTFLEKTPGHKYIDGSQDLLLLNDYSSKPGGGIPLATYGGTNDYFYVLDNKAGNDNSPISYANTLLVYEVKFADDPSVDPLYRNQTRYYTVNFNGKVYSAGSSHSGLTPNEGYSIRRGVRYTVTATIKSNGTDHPLSLDAILNYKIEAEDWLRIEDYDVAL